MMFRLIVKEGMKDVAVVDGKELDLSIVKVDDLGKVIEVEQWLERMFGRRFHITQLK